MLHSLKGSPEYFEDLLSGNKTFEVRWNDRDFQVGDYLAINEYKDEKYTGRFLVFRVTYVLKSPEFCKEGFVIMGITPYTLSAVSGFPTKLVAMGMNNH